jgi:hypothetical protein
MQCIAHSSSLTTPFRVVGMRRREMPEITPEVAESARSGDITTQRRHAFAALQRQITSFHISSEFQARHAQNACAPATVLDGSTVVAIRNQVNANYMQPHAPCMLRRCTKALQHNIQMPPSRLPTCTPHIEAELAHAQHQGAPHFDDVLVIAHCVLNSAPACCNQQRCST